MTEAENKSVWTMKRHPYLALIDEQCGIFDDYDSAMDILD